MLKLIIGNDTWLKLNFSVNFSYYTKVWLGKCMCSITDDAPDDKLHKSSVR